MSRSKGEPSRKVFEIPNELKDINIYFLTPKIFDRDEIQKSKPKNLPIQSARQIACFLPMDDRISFKNHLKQHLLKLQQANKTAFQIHEIDKDFRPIDRNNHNLSEKTPHFKCQRIRGDGACFYRSVMIRYFEQLITSTDADKHRWLSHIESNLNPILDAFENNQFKIPKYIFNHLSRFKCFIEILHENPKILTLETFTQLHRRISPKNQLSLDLALVYFLHYSLLYYVVQTPDQAFRHYALNSPEMDNALAETYKNLTGLLAYAENELIQLPHHILPIQIIIRGPGTGIPEKKDSSGEKLIIDLLLKNAHYDILYVPEASEELIDNNELLLDQKNLTQPRVATEESNSPPPKHATNGPAQVCKSKKAPTNVAERNNASTHVFENKPQSYEREYDPPKGGYPECKADEELFEAFFVKKPQKNSEDIFNESDNEKENASDNQLTVPQAVRRKHYLTETLFSLYQSGYWLGSNILNIIQWVILSICQICNYVTTPVTNLFFKPASSSQPSDSSADALPPPEPKNKINDEVKNVLEDLITKCEENNLKP